MKKLLKGIYGIVILLCVVLAVVLVFYINTINGRLNKADQNEEHKEINQTQVAELIEDDTDATHDTPSGETITNNAVTDEPSNSEDIIASDDNDIISDDNLETEVEEQKKSINMVFIGDSYYNESREANYKKDGITGVMCESLVNRTQNADIAVLDVECALTERGEPMPDKEYTYRMSPTIAASFKEMGFDVATIANNHSLDFGTIGLSDTFDTLDSLGIKYIGAGDDFERAAEPAVFEIGGRKIAILAASRVIPVVEWNIVNRQPGMLCTYDSHALCEAIEKAKKECDYVIAFVHWGVMETEIPADYQPPMAHAYIDAGADLVLASHPHVIQGAELYKGKPIFYSLGNFLYGTNIKRTFMLNVNIDEDGNLEAGIIPCNASSGTTYEMNSEDGQNLIKYMNSISFNCYIDENGVVKEANE